MGDMIKMVVVLTVLSAFSGGLLAAVRDNTKDKIENHIKKHGRTAIPQAVHAAGGLAVDQDKKPGVHALRALCDYEVQRKRARGPVYQMPCQSSSNVHGRGAGENRTGPRPSSRFTSSSPTSTSSTP